MSDPGNPVNQLLPPLGNSNTLQITTDQARNTLLGQLAVTLGDIETILTAIANASSALQTAWTPTITSAGGGAAAYTSQAAFVSKSRAGGGFLNFIQGRIVLSGLGTLGAGAISISGLPVASANVTGAFSIVDLSIDGATVSGGNTYFFGRLDPNTSAILIRQGGSTATAAVNVAGLTAGANTFIFSGFYASLT